MENVDRNIEKEILDFVGDYNPLEQCGQLNDQ